MKYCHKALLHAVRIGPRAVSLGMAIVVGLAAGLGVFPAAVDAATYWKADAVDNNWFNTDNWDNDVPSGTNGAHFNGASTFTTLDMQGLNTPVAYFDFSGATCAAYTFGHTGMMTLWGDFTIHDDVTTTQTFANANPPGYLSFRIYTIPSHTITNDGTGPLNLDYGIMSNIANGEVIFDGSGDTNVRQLFLRTNAHQLSIVKEGSGTVTIADAYPAAPTTTGVGYSNGTTTINQGVLSIDAEGNLGGNPGVSDPDALLFGGGTLKATATFAIDDANRGVTVGAGGGTFDVDAGQTLTVANEIVGSGTLAKTGDGTLTLSHDNSSYSGGISVSGGTLMMGNAAALGSTAGTTTVNTGGTLDLNGQSNAEPIVLNGGTLRASNLDSTLNGTLTLDAPSQLVIDKRLSIQGQITGASGFSTSGGTALRLYNPANDYAGATTFGSTYTDLEADEVIPDTSDVTLNRYLNMRGHTETLHSLAGPSSSYLYNSYGTTATLIIGAGDGGADFAGRLWNNSSPIDIVKIGAGTQTFSGTNNDYEGTTTVEGGVLKITNGTALGSTADGTTVVGTGAMVELEGDITVAEPITLTGYGISWRGALSSLSGTNTWSGPITVASTARIGVRTSNTFSITGGITGTGSPQFVGSSGGIIRIADNPINVNGSLYAADNSMVLLKIGGNSWGTTYLTYGGTLKLGIDDAMPATTVVSIGESGRNTNGTLDLNGHNQTIAGLADYGTGNRRVVNSGSGTPTLTVNNSGDYTFAGVLGIASQDGFNLKKTGGGMLTLSGANAYTGQTTIEGGILTLGNNAALGATSSGTLVKTGGTLDLNGFSTTEPITLDGGTVQSSVANSGLNGTLTLDSPSFIDAAQALNLFSQITGASGFTKTGAQQVRLYNILNNYQGPTILNQGYVDLYNDEVIPDASDVTVNSYINMLGHTETIRSLSGNSSGSIYSSQPSAVLRIGAGDGGADFGGRIWNNSHAIDVVKIGAGTQTFSGANNDYTGTTTIQAGTLKLGSNGLIDYTPLIDVQSGATFDVADVNGGFQLKSGQTLMGEGDVLGNLTLLDGSTHAPGSSPGIQTIVGNYDLQSNATLQIELDGTALGTGYDQVDVDGTVTLGGNLELLLGFAPDVSDFFTIIDNGSVDPVSGTFTGLAEGDEVSGLFGGQSYNFVISYQGNDGNDVVLGTVPEPSTALLALLAAIALSGLVRRGRKH